MKKLMLSIIVISTLVCQTAFARKRGIQIDENRTVKVVGQIQDLTAQADKVLKLEEESHKPIYIYIDTPGGSVVGGLLLVRAIDRVRTRGVKVVCVVDGMSMSMGMHILAACDKNYALPTSLLMYHEIAYFKMFAKITERSSDIDGKQLRLLGDYLDKRLQRRLGVSKEVFKEFLENEYIQYGSDFKNHAPKFLNIVHDIRLK